MRVTDGQMDNRNLIARPRLHSIQRGKNHIRDNYQLALTCPSLYHQEHTHQMQHWNQHETAAGSLDPPHHSRNLLSAFLLLQ